MVPCLGFKSHAKPLGRVEARTCPVLQAARFLNGANLTVQVDQLCEIFQSGLMTRLGGDPNTFHAVDGDAEWLVNGTIINPETRSEPVLFHMNGPKDTLPRVFGQLYPGLTSNAAHVRDYALSVWDRPLAVSHPCPAGRAPQRI